MDKEVGGEKLDKKNKIILISGISVASLVLLTAIVSASITPEAPDPKQMAPRAKVVYMASEEFSRLPEQKKVEYMRKAGRSRGAYQQLSSEERQAVFKNTRKVMHKEMMKRLDKFFAMSKEEQNKELDKAIAGMDAMRKAHEARNANNHSRQNNSNNRRPNHRAFMQGVLEGTDSTTRAKISEFFRRLQQRRKETAK